MSADQITRVSWIVVVVVLAALAAIGILDLILIRTNPSGPSVSSTIWALAHEYPVIVLLTGIVLGHLFWPQHG